MGRLVTPLLTFLVLAASASLAVSAAPGHHWSFRVGGSGYELGSGYDSIEDIALDPWGNIYATGSFTGTVDFGGGPLVANGEMDAFLAKYGADGTHIWSKRLGGNHIDTGMAVAVDATGNVAITGLSDNGYDIDTFLIVHRPSSIHRWSKLPTRNANVRCDDVAFSPSGDVIVTGTVEGSINFGGGTIVSASTDGYLAQYDSLGAHEWSRLLGGNDYDYGQGVAVDALGSVVVTGRFMGTVSFGGASLVSPERWSMYVAKYTAMGAHLWSLGAGSTESTSNARGHSVTIGPAGSVILTGEFNYAADFGGGVEIGSGSDQNIFLVKYDANGAYQWSRALGGTDHDVGQSVAVDNAGNIALAGYFQGTTDLGGGPLPTVGWNDICVAKYNSAGDHIWSRSSGGTPGPLLFGDYGRSVAMDAVGNVLLAGHFFNTANFGGDDITATGRSDGFIAKYSAGLPTAVRPGPVTSLALRAQPNPFNPGTTLRFVLPQHGHVRIDIHDVHGALVTRLLDGVGDAGANEVRWDGRDGQGRSVASAVYFARMEFQGETRTTKLILMK